MKRFSIFLLALLLCLPNFAGCTKKEEGFYQGRVTVSCVVKRESKDLVVGLVLTRDAQAEILSTLNTGEWTEGSYDCGHYFELTISKAKLQYQPHMGVFYDVTNNKVFILSPEARQQINLLLGAIPGRLGFESVVKLLRYNEDGNGVSSKIIFGCELADSIIKSLQGMNENGIVTDGISDMIVDEDAILLPVDPGTFWVEAGSKIYRLDPDMDSICLAESHLGMGYVLDMSQESKNLLVSAWNYDPWNYYVGSYVPSEDSLELEHTNKAPSTVDISVLKVLMAEDENGTNKIILQLTPRITQTLDISLSCNQGNGSSETGDQKTVTLKAGKPETVELTFGGFSSDYQLDIEADNTRISLKIMIS